MPTHLFWLSLTQTALAAEVTELPPYLRGDVEFGYEFAAQAASLVEDDEKVGESDATHHNLTYGGVFSPWHGTGVWFQLPHHAQSKIAFDNTYEMVFDPNLDSGTMLNTDELSGAPEVTGNGLGGMWIGARGTPFSESLFEGRPDCMTMLLDIGYRFQDKSNFFTTNESDSRGGGTGAAAWRLRMAFSTEHRTAEPYIQLTYQHERNLTQDVSDESGTLLKQDAVLDPANSMDVLTGVEVLAFENAVSGMRVAVDFQGRFGYESHQDIPSGIFLPSVVPTSYGDVVTQSESAYARGGIGFNWRMFEYLQLNVATDVGTRTPTRLEHPYAVSTGTDTIDWSVSALMKIRVRDAGEAIQSVGPSPESSGAPETAPAGS